MDSFKLKSVMQITIKCNICIKMIKYNIYLTDVIGKEILQNWKRSEKKKQVEIKKLEKDGKCRAQVTYKIR